MTGRQLAMVLALAMILPLLCGFVPACSTAMHDVTALTTFVAGGMIGLAQAQAKVNPPKDAAP